MSHSLEVHAREVIDAMLAAAGWTVQDLKELNLSASRGVAVREMQSMGGPADLYNVQMLGPAGIDDVCSVTVSTIQRLYAQLANNAQFDD